MTKLLFAAAIVAALVAVATSAPLSANEPTPVTCLECTILGNLVEVLLKQGKTQDQIDQEVQMVCARLPAPLLQQCLNAVSTQLDPLIQALQTSNNDVKAACKAIGKCAADKLNASPLPCLLCEVEAGLLKKMLQTNSKEEIDTQLQAVCSKLPAALQSKCQQAITTVIDPILVDLKANPDHNPKQACVAAAQCPATFEDVELIQLVEASMTAEDPSPIDCIVCSVEAALLQKALQNNTKDQIDIKIQAICGKLPQQLQMKCQDCLTNKINPLIDELQKNVGETPKQACQNVMRCQQSVFEQLVERITATDNNQLDCIVCNVEAALLTKALQNNTKAQIDTKLNALCSKLPQPLQPKCQAAVTDKLNPLIDELQKNAGETPKQACQNLLRCQQNVFEELVEKITASDRCRFRNCVGDNKLDCIVCGVEAALLTKALQNNTKDQIDTKLAALCSKLPQQLQQKCLDAVNQKINPLIDELQKNAGETPKQACVNVMRCAASSGLEELVEKMTVSDPNPIDCIACSVEAAVLTKALQTQTKQQIDANLTMLCNKLPQQLQQKCLDGINQKIDPLIDELQKNAGEAPKQACVNVMRCAANNFLEELVEKVTVTDPNPIDCIACAVEASMLTKALQTQTKQQIDANLTMLCNKLPQQLQQKCLDAINQKIDPLIVELQTNAGEAPKVACQHVMRCAASEVEEEFMDIATALVAPAVNPAVDCVVCSLEASLLAKALEKQMSKNQIEDKLQMVCSKLPANLVAPCHDAVTMKIDPLIDALVANQNDPKTACKVVQRCQM